jgi:SulP family sulfate permease
MNSDTAKYAGHAALVREVSSGLIGSLLSLTYCFSYGALIFAGPLALYLADGVAAALMTGAAAAILVALMSGFRLAVAGPVSHTAAPLATMIGALLPTIAARPSHEVLMLSLAALMVATLVTATALFALGWGRLGMLVRFVPYPVMAGFLASTGWLIITGGLRLASDVPLTLSSVLSFPRADLFLGLTAVWAASLCVLTSYTKHYLALPAAIVSATLLVHLALTLLGVSEESARALGFMFGLSSAGRPMALLLDGAFLHVDWLSLAPIAGNILVVAVMAAISVLLNSTGLELAGKVDADLDRELKVHGIANVASAFLGGFVGHVSVSNTMANRAAGGRGRLSGVVVGLVCLSALAGGSQVLGYVPRFILGGFLAQLGLRLIWEWGWLSRLRLPPYDWLVVIAIVMITAVFGFLQGVLFGLIASCAIFAIDVSRIGVIRRQFQLNERPSIVVRSIHEMRILADYGDKVQIIELKGFIFFGSAYWLQDHIKKLVRDKRPEVLVFDFNAVTGTDSSARASFSSLSGYLSALRVRTIVVGLSPETVRAFDMLVKAEGAPEVLTTLDQALELCEELILAEYQQQAHVVGELSSWFTDAMGSADMARKLISYLKPATTFDGDCLCRQGDPSNELLIIQQGRVSVTVERPGQAPLLVRVFGPHTVVGEIGFFCQIPRTATMRIAGHSLVWALDQQAFRKIKQSEPELAAALLVYIVELQAERLSFTTRQVTALQR